MKAMRASTRRLGVTSGGAPLSPGGWLSWLMLALFGAACGGASSAAPPAEAPRAETSAPRQEGPLQRGAKAIQQQQFDQAERELSEAVRQRPSDAQAHYYLGVAQHGLGDLEAAEASYRKSSKLSPQLTEAWINLGAVLLDGGNPAAALDVTQAGLERSPEQPQLLYNRALALEGLGRLEDAVAAYAAALRAQPQSAEVRFGYAQALLASQQEEKAKQQLLTLLSAKEVAVLASTARLLARLEEFASCVRALDAALAQEASAELLVERGLCKHALHQDDEALADYRAAVDAGPDYAAAHYYLGMHLRAMGDTAGAERSLRRAVELAGDSRLGAAAKKALSRSSRSSR